MLPYKKIPYGITDFELFNKEQYYYVDKTQYIPLIEQSPSFLFLIRPRRFGKSLWLSVLEDYYEVTKKDQFDVFFKNTYIAQHQTENRNKYLFLKFNFSQVNPDEDKLENSFENHCSQRFYDFNMKYNSYFDSEYLNQFNRQQNSYDKLECVFNHCSSFGLKLFIIIDEYDNFANTILSEPEKGTARYLKLTHGEGFFRFFFNKLKGGTTGSGAGIAKLFITGVSPLTLDDVTSGFNIGWNVSNSKILNGLVGFTREEVIKMIEYYRSKNLIPYSTEELLTIMNVWYNNYRFSKGASETMYNSDMVLYFINYIILEGEIPTNLIDENVKTDYNKLKHLLILDKKINGNFSILKSILETGEVVSEIIPSFSVNALLRRECFISLLHYFGLLTIAGEAKGRISLKIPNQTIFHFFSSYLRRGFEDTDIFKIDIYKFSELMTNMAYSGNWKPVFEFLADEIKTQTKIRDYIQGENMIKGFLLAYLNITSHFVIQTERELNKGYADMYLEPFFIQHKQMTCSYIIELKYIKRNEEEPIEMKIKTLVDDAKVQLNQYAADDYVKKTKGATELKKIAMVWHGWELVHSEEILNG
jgi:hypothetical protein